MKIRKSEREKVIAEIILEPEDIIKDAKCVRIVEENKDDETYDYGVYVTVEELEKIVKEIKKRRK